MSAPIDPNAPTIQAGETAANFRYRQQDYAYKNGAGGTGPNPTMAATWRGQQFTTDPTLGGIEVK